MHLSSVQLMLEQSQHCNLSSHDGDAKIQTLNLNVALDTTSKYPCDTGIKSQKQRIIRPKKKTTFIM